MSTIKSWNGPFCTDHMRTHLCDQHTERGEEYEILSDEKQMQNFDDYFSYTYKLMAHLGTINKRVSDVSIVPNVNDGMLGATCQFETIQIQVNADF